MLSKAQHRSACVENLQFHSLPFFSITDFFPGIIITILLLKTAQQSKEIESREKHVVLSALCVSVPGEDEIFEARSVRSVTNLREKIVLGR